jgi:hypothetical protein
VRDERPPRFVRTKSPPHEFISLEERSRRYSERKRLQQLQKISPFENPDPSATYDLLDLLRSKEENIYYRTLFDDTSERVQEGFNNAEIVNPTPYRVTKTACRDALAEAREGVRLFRAALSKFFQKSEPTFFGWIRNDGRIMANLNRLRNRGLLPVAEDLTERTIPYSESQIFGEMKIKGRKRSPALVRPDVPGMAKRVGISESQIWKFIEGGVRAGFWRWFAPAGHRKHGRAFLLVGYHHFYKVEKDGKRNWNSRVIYLIDKTKKRKLGNFCRPD